MMKHNKKFEASCKVKLWMLVSTFFLSTTVYGFTLWSENHTFMGTGKMHGPGANVSDQDLFPMVLSNLSFTTSSDWIMPFFNNGTEDPNICGENELLDISDGRLSNDQLINENASMCSMTIAGTDMLIAVVNDSSLQGEQHYTTLKNGDIEVRMDLALDLNIGDKGIIKMPFFGTTGTVTVPMSLQTQNNEQGVDAAGKYESGTELKGRIGDFNQDGWIDGTMVSVGNMPLDSPVFPGQPFAMQRNFELNIPVKKFKFGNVKALVETRD